MAARLPDAWEKVHLDWPGGGDEPHDPAVRGFDDLVARAAAALDRPSDVVAQSMGGAVAIRLALSHPDRVRRLVLAATSGGVDAARDQGADWRTEYRAAHPGAAAWVTGEWPDETEAIGAVTSPTLLLWGDADPISPVAVGERLAGLLPDATLRVIAAATHSFAHDQPALVAPLVAVHLGRPGGR